MMKITELYCAVDDCYKAFMPMFKSLLLSNQARRRNRPCRLSDSEIMTIIIYFHQSHYRNFKHYYKDYVSRCLCAEFPQLVSYNRFVELMPRVLVPLCAYLNSRKGKVTGLAYIDSAKLSVCHNLRIPRHQVFAEQAARGKTSTGWFYGFKLHLVANEQGELLAFSVTPGNVDDRVPVPHLCKTLFGKLFGDKGYLSQPLFELLFKEGLQLITTVRKNMKNRLMPLMDRILLRKRFIIETIIDQLKNISQIEHTRHRSLANFMINIFAGLIAYTHQEKKPSLNINPKMIKQLESSFT